MSLQGAQRRSNPLAPRDGFGRKNAARSNDARKGDAMAKQYYVYIMTNAHNTVLYTGVTNNLARRVYEHKNGIGSVFTKRYNVHKLVYYEVGNDVNAAIAREKQIKGGSRQKKIDLINSLNPEWRDLYEELL